MTQKAGDMTAPAMPEYKSLQSRDGDAAAAVLSVAQSSLGKKWLLTPSDDRLAQGISQAFGLPDILSRILAARGIGFEKVDEFLNPALKTQMPDPSVLQDMDRAAERLADAVINHEKIAV